MNCPHCASTATKQQTKQQTKLMPIATILLIPPLTPPKKILFVF